MRGRLCLVVVLMSGMPDEARSQGFEGVSLVADNDYFNFWMAPSKRPDEGYTQGLRVDLRWDTGSTREHTALGARCACLEVTLGQEVFTPYEDALVPVSGDRPYAGFLYLAATRRSMVSRGNRSLGVRVGVTGPPSLAEATQTAFHRRFGFREPQGWDHQLPFEVAFGISYQERREVIGWGSGTARMKLGGIWGATLGTVRVDSHVGPWVRMEVADPSAAFQLYGEGAATGSWVLRDLFLDGSTFGSSESAAKKNGIGQARFAAGIAWKGVALEYAATFQTRVFQKQPRTHTYGTIALHVDRLARRKQ